MKKIQHPYIFLSAGLAALILVSGGVGIQTPAIYEKEAFEWQVQAVWQDYINVALLMPMIAVAGIYAHKGNKTAEYVWGGSLLYLIYTYVIYCFDVHFNGLFLFYCLVLGIAFYSLAWFLYTKSKHKDSYSINTTNLHYFIATYFIVLGSGFYLLWLAGIISPLLNGTTPADLEKFNLPTNPVHVLDLSIILPAFIILGIMIFSRKGPWKLLSPLMLVFAALMSLTIAGMQVALFLGDREWNPVLTVLMVVLDVTDVILAIKMISVNHRKPGLSSQPGQVLNFN